MSPKPLLVPEPSSVIARPSVVLIEGSRDWTRPPAEFVRDFSGHDLDLKHLLMPGPRRSASKYRSRYDNRLLFGYHHLHALIGTEGEFDCQDIEGYRTRLQYHIRHHPGHHLPIPQISQSEDGFSYELDRIDPSTVEELQGRVFFGTPIEPLNW